MTLFAGPLLATAVTRDPLAVSGLIVAQRLPWLLLSLPGGALVDRLEQPRLMTAVSIVRAVGLGSTGLAVALGHASLLLLYAVFFLVGCASVLFDNASTTLLPAVVERTQLAQANGRLLAGRTLAQNLLAAPLGSWLFTLATWMPFLLDAMSFVLVTALSATLRTARCTRRTDGVRTTLRAEAAEGVRWLLRHRLLRSLALSVGLLNLTLSAALSILVLVAQERLGTGPLSYGLLLTALACGGVVGGLTSDQVIAALGIGTVLRVGLLVEAFTHLVLALTHEVVVAGGILALFGLHSVLFSTCSASLRQTLTPPDLLGRVQSAYRLLSAGGASLGALFGGFLARYFGLTAPFWLGLAAAVVLTVCVWGVFSDPTTHAV